VHARVSGYPKVSDNHYLILASIAIGGGLSFIHARRVDIAKMPQMIALYNGLGGGAAATIAAVELLRAAEHGTSERILAVVGALIGCVAFSGSLLAFAKLNGWMSATNKLANRQVAYVAIGTGLRNCYDNTDRVGRHAGADIVLQCGCRSCRWL